MLTAAQNGRAIEDYNQQILHRIPNPRKPVLTTNRLKDDGEKITDKDRMIFNTVTNSLLQGGNK